MKLTSILRAAWLIAGINWFSIQNAKAVETMVGSAAIPFTQLDIFSDDDGFNVVTVSLISLGIFCFMKLRGRSNE